MHIIKLHSSDCKSVLEEASRDHKSKVGTIDESRTHLNYSLAPEENRVTDANAIKERIKALGVTRKIRDDAVLSCSCIITLPTDYKGDTEAFMRSAYKALTETLCKGNENRVIQAEVHMDEKTPHMHFAFIPITEKVNKKGKSVVALDAKNLLTKTFMREFHPLTEKLISEDLKTPVKLYDEEKCKERAEKHSRGDFSADYEDIEAYKARKSKEEAKKKLEDTLEDITLTIGGKELELCEKNGDLDSIGEELTQKALEKEKLDKDTLKAQKALIEAENALSAYETEKNSLKAEIENLKEEKQTLSDSIKDLIESFKRSIQKLEKAIFWIRDTKPDKALKAESIGKSLYDRAMKEIEIPNLKAVSETIEDIHHLTEDIDEDRDIDI